MIPEKSFLLNAPPWSVTRMAAEVLPSGFLHLPSVCWCFHRASSPCGRVSVTVTVALTAGALLVGWAAPGMRDYTAAWGGSNIMLLALCMVNGTISTYGSKPLF